MTEAGVHIPCHPERSEGPLKPWVGANQGMLMNLHGSCLCGSVTYEVKDGRLQAGDLLVHFAVPFRQWYEDQVHT